MRRRNLALAAAAAVAACYGLRSGDGASQSATSTDSAARATA